MALVNKEIPAPHNVTMANPEVRQAVIEWNRKQNAEYRAACKLGVIAGLK